MNNSGPMTGAERGLLRLMLKLPALRGRLQILVRGSQPLEDLLEAYDDATVMLEKLAKDSSSNIADIKGEYQTICAELEADVIEFCLTHE